MGQPTRVSQHDLERRALEALGALATKAGLRSRTSAERSEPAADAIVSLGGERFVLECIWASDAASVSAALRRLAHPDFARRRLRPLLAVAFMGPTGRRLCADAHVAWFDLAGNADVSAPGLHLHVEGLPNRFRRPGPRGGFFAPKASRVVRWLLLDHPKPATQRDLVRRTELEKGFVSRILTRLVATELVAERSPHEFRVLDPARLLDAWLEAYAFDRHGRRAGIVAPAKGPEILRRLERELARDGVRTAATGLAGAWLLRHHAPFRLATVYVDRMPSNDALQRLEFHEEAKGSNAWILLPNDPGVFHGSERRDELEVASDVQVWLDLSSHPERSEEAAADLRAALLERWSAR